MNVLLSLFSAIAGLLHLRQGVREHSKRQAFGPRWSKHRPRRIGSYRRRRF